MDTKIVLLHGFDDEQAIKVMRAVKAAVEEPRSVAFAVSTTTNRGWKLGDLIDHVGEEHRAFLAREEKGKMA
jgi:hypothetical protein